MNIMNTENNKDIFFPAGTAEVNIIPVMQGEEQMKVESGDLPDTLPILALRNAVLFPGMVYPVTIGRQKSITLIKEAEKRDSFIGAVPQVDVTVEDPTEKDLYEYGTVSRVMKVLEMPDGTITAIIQGIKRLRMDGVLSYEPYITARVKYIEDIIPENDNSTKMIAESLKEKAAVIIKSSSFAPKEAVGALKSSDNYAFLVNFIATTVEIENFMEKVQLLGIDDITVRAMKLLQVLDTQIQLLKIKQEINQKVKSDIDQQQREYYLNNQLRTIQEELGMDEEEEFEKFRAKAKTKKWPEAVGKQFEKELAKLEKYNPSSPDYSKFLLDLPWGEMSKDNLDLKHAQKVLDSDHYGLDTVKERIIEYIGDSYTCGYGTESSNKERFKPETENQNLTYACAMARYFDADQIVVAHSGMGISRNYNGNVKGYFMPDRYLQTYDLVKDVKWDAKSFPLKPGITVIYLGTNDFSTGMQPAERLFVKNYITLLKEIKDNYGEDYPILCVAPKNDLLMFDYIRKALDSCGLKNVHIMALTKSVHNNDSDMGADGHPNYAGHLKKAHAMIPYVSTITGWELTGNEVK